MYTYIAPEEWLLLLPIFDAPSSLIITHHLAKSGALIMPKGVDETDGFYTFANPQRDSTRERPKPISSATAAALLSA